MWHGNGYHKGCGSRLKKFEEMLWSRPTVRQKDDSETEEDCLQNNDQASNAVWNRNVNYNEET